MWGVRVRLPPPASDRNRARPPFVEGFVEADLWLGVEVRHLAALQAIARAGTFGAAASQLGYTQSAISQQIAVLERRVGERLVDRPNGTRQVALTDAGTLLLRHAETILGQLRAARSDLTALTAGERGTLRVGTFQSVGARLLPAIMRRFSETRPDVEIELVEEQDTDELLRLLEIGALDFAFATPPLPDRPLGELRLLRDPFVLVVPAESDLADSPAPLPPELLAELRLVTFRRC
ncbi:MAG: hypothetical protein QOE36_1286, partial [Gaiellaceae bacterium]|nr:hypothetical protein [Gaiellaceae bacterium]